MSNSTVTVETLLATTWEAAEPYVPKSLYGQALALIAGFPLLAILLNVARQVLLPRDPKLPPEVFHLIPVFGSAASYGNDPIGFFESCRRKYGDCFTFVLLGRKMTVCMGPRGSNLVLGGKLSQVSAEEAYTHLTTPVFGEGVVYDCPNHMLMEQKRFVKFGLSQENFEAYVGMIDEEVTNFLNKDTRFATFQENDPSKWDSFHAFRTLSEITILTASRTLQGKEVRGSLDKTFSQRYLDLDGGFTPINFMFPNLPLPSYRRRDRAQKAMSDFYVDILRKRQAGKSEHDHDMMASLMGQSYKDGTPLSERDIAHILIALLMAGQHTSSATSSWMLLHVAENPDVGEALYQEQVEKFRNADGSWRTMTYDELRKLPVLDSVIRETLRLHPPIHSIIRKVISDIPVPPTLSAPSEDKTYLIPKGHFVMASPAVSQVDPLIWAEPLKWNPARWAESAAQTHYSTYYEAGEKVDFGFGVVSKGTESPYQPFGAGRHRCIGEQFAYLQIGAILATLVRNIEMKLTHPVPEHNYHTMITLPKDPCDIAYRRRTKA
ncbi:cytochrome P450 [Exidia glandulosa HHB12029]|uniref:Cytochrome P450 n=1 Tax=Exidia glandulosa HHB12029 TaxID=1314781 RepID=A0A165L846_EXIGL|nr:cytochrome P450 [Exidia glandulosa HHB12029]